MTNGTTAKQLIYLFQMTWFSRFFIMIFFIFQKLGNIVKMRSLAESVGEMRLY